jgi:hypothetical protein
MEVVQSASCAFGNPVAFLVAAVLSVVERNVEIMEHGKCRDCFYWQQFGNAGLSGDCHRYPPVIQGENTEAFPVVRETGWCGEFLLHA